jgi:hypothetical protein
MDVDASPFPYQGPLQPEQVQGRDELVDDLIGRVTSHRVTALLGPRRYGKTSVLRKVAAELTEVTTLWVDLYEVTSMADVAVRFDDAFASTTGTFAAAARQFAASVSLNLGVVKVELVRPPRDRPDPPLVLNGLLDVLVKTATAHPTLLVIDEFSSIARVNGAAGALRTALQHHYTDLGILFAGSQPSMMRTLFTDRVAPFYGQADLVDIGPLPRPAALEIIIDGFDRTGRDAGTVAGLITDLATGHPQRTMQLADACWRATAPGATAGSAEWSAALDEVRHTSDLGLERFYSSFAQGERSVLRAVARSGRIYGAEAQLLDLSAGTAAHARQALLNAGDLVETETGLALVDPLLADWIRRRFPI